ncbi:Zinc finger A20 and AN1 domain-containing stress-associated protein [Dirofilaria immitis]
MKNNDDNEESKGEEATEKNVTVPSDSQQIETHLPNSSLYANMKFVKETSSQKKNEKIVHQKISNERKRTLKSLTSPGGRSPEVPNTPTICKTATKSKSENYISRTDMVVITIKSTVSSFKPLKLIVKKTMSIRMLKNYLQLRFAGANQITLIHKNKELKYESGSLASVGITSGSVLWLLVNPITGNNDREEISSLIRMSQSLANLRNLIRTLPPINSSESSFPGSAEHIEITSCGYKEAEHEQMREKMKLLIRQREKVRRNITKNLSENKQQKIQEISGKEVTADLQPQSSSLITLSPFIQASANIVKQKELATYFDPPETIKQRKFEKEELFDVPSNESELLKIKDEIKKKRCGLCRMKLQIADREIQCICKHIFCSKHRNPQIHRCSIDLKSIDRVHIRTALPKLMRDISKSKT